MKIRVYIFFALFLVISTGGIAQQQPSFMQYMYNTLAINPAYAGYHRSPVFNLSGNSQFTDINGNPTSAVLSFHGNALNEKVGLGAMISSCIAWTRKRATGFGRMRVTITSMGRPRCRRDGRGLAGVMPCCM